MPRVHGLQYRRPGFSSIRKRRAPSADPFLFDDDARDKKAAAQSGKPKEVPVVSQETSKETSDVPKATESPALNNRSGESNSKKPLPRSRRRKRKRKASHPPVTAASSDQFAPGPLKSPQRQKKESPRKLDMEDSLEFSFASPALPPLSQHSAEEDAPKHARVPVDKPRDESSVCPRTSIGSRVIDVYVSPVDGPIVESRKSSWIEAGKFRPNLKSSLQLTPRYRQQAAASLAEKSKTTQDVQWMDSITAPHSSPPNAGKEEEESKAALPAISNASKRSHPKSPIKDLSRVLVGISEENDTLPEAQQEEQSQDSVDLDACTWILNRERYCDGGEESTSIKTIPVHEVDGPLHTRGPKDSASTDQQLQCTPAPLQRNQWDISLPFESPPSASAWRSTCGQMMYWEAHALNHIRKSLSSMDTASQRLCQIPEPVHLLMTKRGTRRVGLRLEAATDESESGQVEMLGTLQDVMRLHCQYNTGPMPESTVAWLVLQAIQIVGSFHRCGVTHNDLGLDSFVLLRRRKQQSVIAEMLLDDEEFKSEWYLQCIGFGAKSHILKREQSDNDLPKSVDGQRREEEGLDRLSCHHWHFEHDLYSLTNMAFTLLLGGIPMTWKHSSIGGYILESESLITGNQYLRGSLAWGELLSALLNPPSSSHGAQSIFVDGDACDNKSGTPFWSALSDACKLLRIVAEAGRESRSKSMDCALETPAGFFEKLMAHVEHEASESSSATNTYPRLPVKLQGDTPHGGMQSVIKPSLSSRMVSTKSNESDPDDKSRTIAEARVYRDEREEDGDGHKDTTTTTDETMEIRLEKCRERYRTELAEKAKGLQEDHKRLLDMNDDCHRAELERHRKFALEVKNASRKYEADLERRLQEMEEALQAERRRHEDEVENMKNRHQEALKAKQENEDFLLQSNELWQSMNSDLEAKMNAKLAKLEDERNSERLNNRVLNDSLARFRYELERRTDSFKNQEHALTQCNQVLSEELERQAHEISQLQQMRARDVAAANSRNYLGRQDNSRATPTTPFNHMQSNLQSREEQLCSQDKQSANGSEQTSNRRAMLLEEADRFRGGHGSGITGEDSLPRDFHLAQDPLHEADGVLASPQRLIRSTMTEQESHRAGLSRWSSRFPRLSFFTGSSISSIARLPKHQADAIIPGLALSSTRTSTGKVNGESSRDSAPSDVREKLCIGDPSDSDTD